MIVTGNQVELGACSCGSWQWEAVKASVHDDGSLDIEATCYGCGAAFGAKPHPSAEERRAEICRAHFIDGVSILALAERYFVTVKRIEDITRPVREMLDGPEMRSVLADAIVKRTDERLARGCSR